MSSVSISDIEQAAKRLRNVAQVTPVLTSPELEERSGATVFLKCENFQRTGSFKFRGAYNAVSALDPSTAGQAVVTVSSGNHGQALALAAKLFNRPAHVITPGTMTERKRSAILSHGATVHDAPTRAAADAEALAWAEQSQAILVHPFNNLDVIAGQGTCALEFLSQAPDLDILLAPVGGGGLLSGTCVAAHALRPSIKIYACEPNGALDALYSVREHRIVPMADPQTIADGLRSSLGPLTLEILERHLAGFITVDETEILAGLRFAVEHLRVVIEPSSAVALAPVLRGEPCLRGRRVGVILTGGNIESDLLCHVLTDEASDRVR